MSHIMKYLHIAAVLLIAGVAAGSIRAAFSYSSTSV